MAPLVPPPTPRLRPVILSRNDVVRHSMPPLATTAPLLRPASEVSRAASTGRRAPVIRRKESTINGWGDTPGKPEGLPFGDPPEMEPLPVPLPRIPRTPRTLPMPTFRCVPLNCGGTFSSDMSCPASRRIGAVDLTDSVGVYFSIGVRRCFVARISAKVLNLYGPPEFATDPHMADKIRFEVASRLKEEARRSHWPAPNAHMRETAWFVSGRADDDDWGHSTLLAVVLGVKDWLGWKGKIKRRLLEFGGQHSRDTHVHTSFVMNRKVLGDAGPTEIEVAEGYRGIDDIGSGQLWEINVVRSVPCPGDHSRVNSLVSLI